MKEALLQHLEKINKFTLKELVLYTNQLLPVFAAKQKRYKVAELVNERIVRYYIHEGLINRPAYRKGRYGIFTCLHILQILAIKYLQSTYMPLKKISEITRTLTYDDLKSLLLDRAALNLLLPGVYPNRKGPVKKPMQGPEPGAPTIYDNQFAPYDRSGTSWRRFQIHDKLELNVEEHFNILGKEVDIKTIFSRIMQALAGTGQQYRQDEEPNLEDVNFDDLDLGYVSPALPLKDRSRAVIALVTEGGLVPKGNPDKLEPARASRFLRYNLRGIDDLRSGEFESVDRGWNNAHVNDDPDRLLPLDIMRELEKGKVYSKLYPYYYTTTGAGTSIDTAKNMGKRIAREMKARGISGVLFTSTWGTGTRCGAAMSKEIENAGIPTALITTLVPTAMFAGAYRIVPGCAINHPLGNPALPTLKEKEMRRKIVLTALESLGTEVKRSEIFNWRNS